MASFGCNFGRWKQWEISCFAVPGLPLCGDGDVFAV